MTEREDAHLMSGSYALHALTDEERAAVEDAMRDSEELRGEIVGLGDTAVALGLSIAPVAPPAALRARILDAIDVLPQQAPAEEGPDLPAAVETAAAPPVSIPEGQHVAPRRRRARRPVVAMVLVAVAALLFGGGFLAQRTLLEPQSEFSAIQQAADHHTRTGAVDGGGTVTVTWSASQHRTSVMLAAAAAPSGKVLQLWSVHGSAITSAGLYQPQGDDHFVIVDGTPASGEKLAITVEPEGGSTQPTTDPIATVSL